MKDLCPVKYNVSHMIYVETHCVVGCISIEESSFGLGRVLSYSVGALAIEFGKI